MMKPEVRQETPTEANFVAQLLKVNNITKVAVIDDVYDKRKKDEFNASEIPDFYALVDPDEDLTKELRQIAGKEINSEADIDDELLQKLWDSRDSLNSLKDSVNNTLFSNILTKQNPLNQICAHLENELGLKPVLKGSDVEVSELEEASIVFIDYYLGAENQASVENAIEIAKNIYKEFSKNKMPLIVLMSSKPEVGQNEEEFRNRSGLLKGMFYFVPKKELENKDNLSLNICSWAKTLPVAVDIQHFINTLEESFEDVKEKFIFGIKSLGLDDYAFIQNLSLQEDGQPLGDYMNWLFNSYYGHLLFEAHAPMAAQIKVVDGLYGLKIPPADTVPSKSLRKIYESALFNVNVEDIGDHPSVAGEAQNPLANLPYVHLGDLLTKDETTEVFMIINAECDLAFGPKRLCRPDDVILLISGKLSSPTKISEQSEKIRTEFFEFNGNPYRIIWDIRKILSKKRLEIKKLLEEDGYERKAQMRLPFALEIQRAFASNLTRVGLPVAPPIHHPVKLQVLGKDGNTLTNLTEVEGDAGFWIATKSNNNLKFLFFFTVAFGHNLRMAIDTFSKAFETKISDLQADGGNPQKIDKLKGKSLELQKLLSNFESWFLDIQSCEFEFKNSEVSDHLKIVELDLYAGIIALTQDQGNGEKYNGSFNMLINVVEDETEESVPDEVVEAVEAKESGAEKNDK